MLLLLVYLPEVNPRIVFHKFQRFTHEEILHLQAEAIKQLIVHEEILELLVGPAEKLQCALLFLLGSHSDDFQ